MWSYYFGSQSYSLWGRGSGEKLPDLTRVTNFDARFTVGNVFCYAQDSEVTYHNISLMKVLIQIIMEGTEALSNNHHRLGLSLC